MTKLLKIGEQWLNPNHIKSAELIDAAEFGIRLFMNDVPEDGAWNRTELASSFYGNAAVALVRWLDANSTDLLTDAHAVTVDADREALIAELGNALAQGWSDQSKTDTRNVVVPPQGTPAYDFYIWGWTAYRQLRVTCKEVAQEAQERTAAAVAECDQLRVELQNVRGERDKWQANAERATDLCGKLLAARDALQAELGTYKQRAAEYTEQTNAELARLRAENVELHYETSGARNQAKRTQINLDIAHHRTRLLRSALGQYAKRDNWAECDKGTCHCQDVLRFAHDGSAEPWQVADAALDADSALARRESEATDGR